MFFFGCWPLRSSVHPTCWMLVTAQSEGARRLKSLLIQAPRARLRWMERDGCVEHARSRMPLGGCITGVCCSPPKKTPVWGEEETWHVEWGAGFAQGSDDINANGPSSNGPSDNNSLNWRGTRQDSAGWGVGGGASEPRKKGLLFIFWMGKVAYNVFFW